MPAAGNFYQLLSPGLNKSAKTIEKYMLINAKRLFNNFIGFLTNIYYSTYFLIVLSLPGITGSGCAARPGGRP
jgi:hypothetical protein